MAFSYLFEAGEVESKEAFAEAVKTGLKHGEEVMTIAEQFRQEGFQKGRLEGIHEGEVKGKLEGIREGEVKGKLETAFNFLKLGVPQEKIIEATGLSFEQIQEFKKKNLI